MELDINISYVYQSSELSIYVVRILFYKLILYATTWSDLIILKIISMYTSYRLSVFI